MAKEKQKQDAQLENVQEALSTSGRWIEKNQNLLTWIVLGILVLALVLWLIGQYVITPHRQAANDENAIAMRYFLQDDYAVALNGNDDDCLGFAAIADKYGIYKAGKFASYCAGVCSYQLGEYDEAISYLKKYSTKEINVEAAHLQLLGDAYTQVEDYDNAVKYFEKVGKLNHKILSPMSLLKAARIYQEQGNEAAALKAYKTIKEKYPQSEEAQTASQYVE